jgi:hypothetical protein
MLSCPMMRKVCTLGLVAGLALAVLAPAFATAGAAPDCGMSCCRLGMAMSHAMSGHMTGHMPARASAPNPDCGGEARCTLRGCGRGAPIAARAGLPPTVLPALRALVAITFAAPLRQGAFRLPLPLALDLPDRPPRG